MYCRSVGIHTVFTHVCRFFILIGCVSLCVCVGVMLSDLGKVAECVDRLSDLTLIGTSEHIRSNMSSSEGMNYSIHVPHSNTTPQLSTQCWKCHQMILNWLSLPGTTCLSTQIHTNYCSCVLLWVNHLKWKGRYLFYSVFSIEYYGSHYLCSWRLYFDAAIKQIFSPKWFASRLSDTKITGWSLSSFSFVLKDNKEHKSCIWHLIFYIHHE